MRIRGVAWKKLKEFFEVGSWEMGGWSLYDVDSLYVVGMCIVNYT